MTRCKQCDEVAAEGRKLCLRHLWADLTRKRKYNRKNAEVIKERSAVERHRRVQDGRCMRCGIDMGGMVGDGVTCPDCRERMIK